MVAMWSSDTKAVWVALPTWLGWLERGALHQKIVGSVSTQGNINIAGSIPGRAHRGGNLSMLLSPSLSFSPLPLLLSLKKPLGED